MAEKVNLMVVGLSGNITREELTSKLVKKFRQDAAAFTELTDAAFGDTEPYAAQSDVSPEVAEEGKAQLEEMGVACEIRALSDDVSGVVAPSDAPATESAIDDLDIPEVDGKDASNGISLAGSAVGIAAGGIASGIISKKKSDNAEGAAPDFSDELASAASTSEASDTKNPTVSAGAIAGGGIADSIISKKTSDGADDAVVDFADELVADDTLDAKVSDSNDAEPAANAEPTSDDPESAGLLSFDELHAELVDPSPKVKEKKADVVLDDGGLTLSDDDSAPLTAAKAKSDPLSADDGGLSLENDGGIESSTPQVKAAETEEKTAPLEETSSANEEVDALNLPAADLATELKEDKVELIEQAVELPEAGLPTEAVNVEDASKIPDVAPVVAADLSSSDVPVPSASDQVSVPNLTEAASVLPIAAPAASAVAQAKGDVVDKADFSAPHSTGESNIEASSEGLVFPSKSVPSFVPKVTPESEIVESTNGIASATSARSANKIELNSGEIKKVPATIAGVAAIAGFAVMAWGASFALKNTESGSPSQDLNSLGASQLLAQEDNAVGMVEPATVATLELANDGSLASLSTEQLLVKFSASGKANTMASLEPYFLDSADRNNNTPQLGAAIPAGSGLLMSVKNRAPHPADQYFDEWSSREDDLILFVGLLDHLVEAGDIDIAQEVAVRTKDKLFAVMSNQRLARAYNDLGRNEEATKLMAMSARDTFEIKGAAERVLAISDYGFTEQAIGTKEDATDTFLMTSILARGLAKPELKTVGLSSAARYFHRTGRSNEAQTLVKESLDAGLQLPQSAAARDLAIRYVALTEARMGLFDQALEHVEIIEDPFAAVSAYHGVALAIESTGDDSSARRVLDMAYRAASGIEDSSARSNLLSKVILASESE